ncbi:DNA polymerase III subunit chi [Marinicellulosiphila megalodicopiae]|uniref:DNA polymerase III subunit chi n=1 Tax=Marinicellulosiphila megalodicopiae TaxID=2724896 RepID=UPI003BAF027E
MTEIDFHILAQPNEQDRLFYTCRLINKIFKQSLNVIVVCDDLDQAKQLSDLLWHFKEDAFIPHEIEFKESSSIQFLIHDKNYEAMHDFHDVCINLSTHIPVWFGQFNRLLEIVCQNETTLKATREHYRFYQSRGYPLIQHDLRPAG